MLLEVPGLQSTPALGKAVFDYQFEIQQARDTAQGVRGARDQRSIAAGCENATAEPLPLNSIAMDMAPREPSREQPAKPPETGDRGNQTSRGNAAK